MEWIELNGGPPNEIEIEGAAAYMGSSWQSLAKAAGDIECAFLNGEVALLGRLHGVPTPLRDLGPQKLFWGQREIENNIYCEE
jgi:2-dehydropantoate 2-reductase